MRQYLQLSQYKLLATVAVLAGCSLAARAATISTGFEGASNTADGYRGVATSGWLSSWATPVSSASIVTASGTVANQSPLTAESGRYLNVTVATNADGQGFVARRYDGGTTGVDASQSVTYSFLFRVGTTPSASNQYYMIFNRPGTDPVTGTDPNVTWAIDSATSNKTWRFSNFVDGTSTPVDSRMPVLQNHVYSFVLTSNAQNKSYSVVVTDLTAGTAAFSSGTLGYRNTSTTSDGTYLHFGAHANASTLSFALDSLSMTSTSAIPETASLGMLGFGAVLLFRRRHS